MHSRAPNVIGPTSTDMGISRSAIVHLDLDGAQDIYHAHGWKYPHSDDPLFESGLKNALTLFERNSIHATMFVVSSSLDNPLKRELVIEALRRGHEVASHTETHPNLLRLTKEQKRLEMVGSREKLESLLGTAVRGFRAPGYQIDRECLELLAASGYEYDSSVFPTRTFARRLESSVAALSVPHHPVPGSPLWEVPLPDHQPFPFPFSPSYALLFGTAYFRWGVNHFRHRGPMVLLFHLTDLADPLPRKWLPSWAARVYTLSNMTAEQKREKCQRMLDFVRMRFKITTTRNLLGGLSSAHV